MCLFVVGHTRALIIWLYYSARLRLTQSVLLWSGYIIKSYYQIPWAGGGERVYAAVGGACLLYRAGELSVVEYGLDRVLHTVGIIFIFFTSRFQLRIRTLLQNEKLIFFWKNFIIRALLLKTAVFSIRSEQRESTLTC